MRFPPSNINAKNLFRHYSQQLKKQADVQNTYNYTELENRYRKKNDLYHSSHNFDVAAFQRFSEPKQPVTVLNQYLEDNFDYSIHNLEQYFHHALQELSVLSPQSYEHALALAAELYKLDPKDEYKEQIQQLQIDKLKAQRNQLLEQDNKDAHCYEYLIHLSDRLFELTLNDDYRKEAHQFDIKKTEKEYLQLKSKPKKSFDEYEHLIEQTHRLSLFTKSSELEQEVIDQLIEKFQIYGAQNINPVEQNDSNILTQISNQVKRHVLSIHNKESEGYIITMT
jgi:hypothetical protein